MHGCEPTRRKNYAHDRNEKRQHGVKGSRFAARATGHTLRRGFAKARRRSPAASASFARSRLKWRTARTSATAWCLRVSRWRTLLSSSRGNRRASGLDFEGRVSPHNRKAKSAKLRKRQKSPSTIESFAVAMTTVPSPTRRSRVQFPP